MNLKHLFFCILLLNIYSSLDAQAPGEQIFDNSKVHEIRFEFIQSDYWQQMVDNYENNADPFDDKPYLMGNVTIDGELVDSVGMRFKGFTSYVYDRPKKPIKIDFNEFVPGTRFDGLRKLNLNNGTGDPGLQRDVVCYDLLNANDVDASRTSFARVYFNDTYWGLYQLIEQVDKEFLQRNFEADTGNLFKNKAWSQFEWFGNNVNQYKGIFELKTNKDVDDWSGFINLMDVINNSSDADFPQAIEEIFNVDLFLKTLIVDVATNNWDSYLEHGRNWYMYEDISTGIFHWIPWDYNFALGGGSFGGGEDDDPCELFPFFTQYIKDDFEVKFYDISFGSNEVDYLWDFGDGNSSTEKEPTHKYAAGDVYNVCLKLSMGPDCEQELCEQVNASTSYESCAVLSDGTFDHEDERALAFLFSFNPFCCDEWDIGCEEEYDFLTGNGPIGAVSFDVDQRPNEKILINRLLSTPKFFDRYLMFFCEFLEDDFLYSKYSDLIDSNRNLIEADVMEDPNALYNFEDFELDLGEEGLKLFISDRIDSLRQEIQDLYSCTLTSNSNLDQASKNFKLAPNPVDDYLRIISEDKSHEPFELNIYSSSGQLVYNKNSFDASSEIINTSKYANGFYFLEIVSDIGTRTTLKFIKS